MAQTRRGGSALRDSGNRIHCEEEGILPVAEPEARPRPRERRGNEAAVEGAGAATGTGGRVMKMLEPVETPLPCHPHVLPRPGIGAPQTSSDDVGAARRSVAEALQADAIGCMLPVSRGCGTETLAPISS